jgi:hypothetical protein
MRPLGGRRLVHVALNLLCRKWIGISVNRVTEQRDGKHEVTLRLRSIQNEVRTVHSKTSFYRITWNGTLLVNVALGVVTVT